VEPDATNETSTKTSNVMIRVCIGFGSLPEYQPQRH
jgi:hypothetical protein